ncbi:restriction endonuclease [Candidatus Nomurabacteria bacterium]|nr:restriction endonuclease [Candidatus Nomurabacteria bacterium]
MEIDSKEIILQLLKGMWEMKSLYLMLFGVVVLALIARILMDLMSRQSQIKWFLGKQKVQDLQKLTPSQFEEYIAELFKSLGYQAVVTGGKGDGGVDVEAEKDGIKHYIQCKKFITSKVPVGAVRDFYGAIADRIDGGKGYFITTNVFTLDAEHFAEDKPIELVDKFKLMEYMHMANVEVPESTPVVCPKCGSELIRRSGKYGPFMGCSTYPKCDYTKKLA